MLIRTTLIGSKALLMHNIRLANPDDYYAKLIKKITGKRKKTEEDRAEIAKYEWLGSLYTEGDPARIVIPTANVLKSFKESAKITKEGKNIVRALSAQDVYADLVFTGPQDPEELFNVTDKDGKSVFVNQTLVGVGTQRVVRTRPIFSNWALTMDWELLINVLDFDDLARIVIQAGRVEGLGDNRSNGWGRYKVKIEKLASKSKQADDEQELEAA